jgi:predicted dehydrogenase
VSTEPLRTAIVGLGRMGRCHLTALDGVAEIDVVALAEPSAEALSAAAAARPHARTYAAVADALAHPGLEACIVVTPTPTHPHVVEAAIEAGVHVLCEKPLAPSPEVLHALAVRAARRGRVLQTVHNWHHASIVERAAQLIGHGALGRVRRLTWETLRRGPAPAGDGRSGNWRVDPAVAGGGVLTDHGWHVFYILRRLIGEDPVTISAALETRRHHQWPVEDTARIRLGFPSASADVLLTWAADDRRNWAEVVGSEGTLRLEDDTLVLARAGDGSDQRWLCPPGLSAGSHHAEWFHGVAREFIAAVTGAAAREGNLGEASLCAALEALARESSRRGQDILPVVVPLLPDLSDARESLV